MGIYKILTPIKVSENDVISEGELTLPKKEGDELVKIGAVEFVRDEEVVEPVNTKTAKNKDADPTK